MSRLVAWIAVLLGVAVLVGACAASPDDPAPAQDGGVLLPGSEVDGGGADGAPDAAASTCGNGKLELGETCDDGNTSSGDGCSATCATESAFDGDACPGKPVTLTPVGGLLRATIAGSTKGAFNHYSSSCGGGSGADVVYTFTPSSSGRAVVKLSAAFSAIVSARASCDVATSESKCADLTAPEGGVTSMELPVFAGTPVSLVVDGYAGASGTFTLDIELSAAVCGNGVAELPETCDDGNKTPGDGCSATCTLESGGVLDACPGQSFFLTGAAGAPRKVSLAGDLKTQGKDNQGASGCFFAAGNNVVYAIKSDVAGGVTASLVTGYAKASLHARSDCASNTYQVGCTSLVKPSEAKLEFPVDAGRWFYVFVDSDGDGGPFTLDVKVTPKACGNGVLDGAEQCDDGNAASGDGCSSTCTLEPLAGVDTCPGHTITLAPQPDGSRTAVVSATTVGLANDVLPCQSMLSSTAPDAVFAVTPDIDGSLALDVSGPFNATVSVIDRCSAPVGERSTVLACSYAAWAAPVGAAGPWFLDGVGSGPKTTRAAVVAGKTYWVIVDGAGSAGAAAGPFTLRMKLSPSQCGNGIVDGAEECDDGGTDANDGCSATCQREPVSRDTCASAEDVAFTDDGGGTWSATLLRGTTNVNADQNFGSAKSQAGACWARGRDAFFKVTAPAAGILRATARSSAFDVILGLRAPACATSTVPASCSNDGPKGVDERVVTVVAPGDVLYLVVDTPLPDVNGCLDPISPTFAADCAKLEESGRFSLDVKVEPSRCGDGFFVPSATEECDDGNVTSGDGCSATCKLEPSPGVDTCPGTPLALTGAGATRSGTITFSTIPLTANYVGACGGNAKDGVVRVTPPISGTLKAKVRNMPGATVHARAVCIDPSTEFLKTASSACPNVVHDTVTFSVSAGTDYFLFVDGLDGATGVPTLDVTVSP